LNTAVATEPLLFCGCCSVTVVLSLLKNASGLTPRGEEWEAPQKKSPAFRRDLPLHSRISLLAVLIGIGFLPLTARILLLLAGLLAAALLLLTGLLTRVLVLLARVLVLISHRAISVVET
jgi:hypothetical protein